jgi:Holliday junction resolvase RusA-like endonuclease
VIRFVVLGRPQPQGSSRMVPIKTPTGNHMVITSANRKLKPWRQEVACMAMIEAQSLDQVLSEGPVSIAADFYFAAPVKMPKGRKGMTTKPDIDKLLRGILDGITGVLIRDDSQVTEVASVKRYGLPERAEITVFYLGQEPA